MMRNTSLGMLAVSAWTARAYGDAGGMALLERQDSAQPPDEFVRRADSAVTVLGDYLYIVGGGLAQKPQGNGGDQESDVHGVNVTLALSLKEDWTGMTAKYSTIESDDQFPTAIGHALWSDEKDKKIFFWGGKDFDDDDIGSNDPKLWTLDVDGKGGGTWSSSPKPDNIKRTAFGAFADCDGKGYVIGGYGEHSVDQKEYDGNSRIAVAGLASYDFQSGKWENTTTKGLTNSGAFQKGSAVCVRMGRGTGPTMFVLGGAETTPTDVDDRSTEEQSFDYAHFWDPKSGKWYKKETQGSRPPNRQGHCAAGAQGPNGTYEIFVYGGFRKNGDLQSDIWVLSLPAFRWFRADTQNSPPRLSMGCVRVGSQMIVVGGNDNPVWNKEDPFKQGLGVLSLNTLEWKEGFEAHSTKYQGPRVVRDWYDERGYDTIPWVNEQVKHMFLGSDDHDEDSTDSNPSGPSPSSSNEPSSSTNTAAIAGGVVGGVVALLLVIALAWWLLRRKGRGSGREAISEADESFAMKGTGPATKDIKYSGRSPVSMTAAEMDSMGPAASELEGHHLRAELGGGRDWKQHAVELPP